MRQAMPGAHLAEALQTALYGSGGSGGSTHPLGWSRPLSLPVSAFASGVASPFETSALQALDSQQCSATGAAPPQRMIGPSRSSSGGGVSHCGGYSISTRRSVKAYSLAMSMRHKKVLSLEIKMRRRQARITVLPRGIKSHILKLLLVQGICLVRCVDER